jgi:hypothetical protein
MHESFAEYAALSTSGGAKSGTSAHWRRKISVLAQLPCQGRPIGLPVLVRGARGLRL